MKDTKDTENKITLLHFLAGLIEEQKEKKYAEIYGFIDDFKHMEKASRGAWFCLFIMQIYLKSNKLWRYSSGRHIVMCDYISKPCSRSNCKAGFFYFLAFIDFWIEPLFCLDRWFTGWAQFLYFVLFSFWWNDAEKYWTVAKKHRHFGERSRNFPKKRQ